MEDQLQHCWLTCQRVYLMDAEGPLGTLDDTAFADACTRAPLNRQTSIHILVQVLRRVILPHSSLLRISLVPFGHRE